MITRNEIPKQFLPCLEEFKATNEFLKEVNSPRLYWDKLPKCNSFQEFISFCIPKWNDTDRGYMFWLNVATQSRAIKEITEKCSPGILNEFYKHADHYRTVKNNPIRSDESIRIHELKAAGLVEEE